MPASSSHAIAASFLASHMFCDPSMRATAVALMSFFSQSVADSSRALGTSPSIAHHGSQPSYFPSVSHSISCHLSKAFLPAFFQTPSAVLTAACLARRTCPAGHSLITCCAVSFCFMLHALHSSSRMRSAYTYSYDVPGVHLFPSLAYVGRVSDHSLTRNLLDILWHCLDTCSLICCPDASCSCIHFHASDPSGCCFISPSLTSCTACASMLAMSPWLISPLPLEM